MQQLQEIIENLKRKDDVDAVFLTGSHGTGEAKSYSDLDIIVVLNENVKKIRSIYRWIDGIFADIFFFDRSDLKSIENREAFSANAMDGLLAAWLQKADIKFDKTRKLTAVCQKIKAASFFVSGDEQWNFWQKINYNYVTNKRYFESNDPLYHEALEFRLLYSVSEMICGYLSLRDIPWRGEKAAVKYFKDAHSDFYNLFLQYSTSDTVHGRFNAYSNMVQKVFPAGYRLWSKDDTIPISKEETLVADEREQLLEYWNSLIR